MPTSLNNLAALYQDMGDYAKAEPLFRQALEIRKQALGENHPDYANSLNNLAVLYHCPGSARGGRAIPPPGTDPPDPVDPGGARHSRRTPAHPPARGARRGSEWLPQRRTRRRDQGRGDLSPRPGLEGRRRGPPGRGPPGTRPARAERDARAARAGPRPPGSPGLRDPTGRATPGLAPAARRAPRPQGEPGKRPGPQERRVPAGSRDPAAGSGRGGRGAAPGKRPRRPARLCPLQPARGR